MKRLVLLLLMITLLCPCAVQAAGSQYDFSFTDRELSGEWKAKNAVTITGKGNTCKIAGKGVTQDGTILTITTEGVYVLTGEFRDMMIVVSADDEDKVQLVLDGATLVSSNGPVLYAENGDKLFITAVKGTQNHLVDGADYSVSDGDTVMDACIFSRVDLCLNGEGSFLIQGNYKHGVVSKDDLIIANTTLTVEAASTALEGKDCLMMTGVTANITAGSNGLRSDHDTDEGRGFIYIKDSMLTINAGSDGIQAETILRADNATMTITTGNGSSNAATRSEWDSWGGSSSQSNSDSGSWKALKAKGDIEVNGGTYVIDSKDDALHANSNLTITGGQFTLTSGDDGIHADNELLISGGDITITKSYEGIEASKLTISGGRMDITASDDGLNAAGGADGSASADRWGRGMFSNGVGEIVISGGYIHINANGDGIDSNNTISISGGVTLVSGSPSSMNAAFDYDGEATVTGGVLIAVGGSGMAQSFTAAENQGCMLFGLNGGPAGRNLAIVDADGTIVASYTPVNSYSSVVVTAPGIQVGNTYTVVLDAVIDAVDDRGYASDVPYSGGTALGSIEMTTVLQGGGGHSMGGGGNRRPGK